MTDIDFLCREAIDDPHTYFARWRDESPVQWSERHRAWIVLGHPELDAAFRAPELSTDRMDAFTARQSPERAAALARAVELLRGWMLFHDPPEHSRLRAPFVRKFTPKAVSALGADIEAECDRLLDGMERGPEHVDLVEAFSHALPAAVIARLFGVPDELRGWLTEWSERFSVVVFGATRRPDYADVARAAGEEFHDHMGSLLRQRRLDPRDDLVSAMAASDELDDLEVLGACSLILFAGHDTTASVISSAVPALLAHPHERDRLVHDPAIRELAVEELLRFDGSAKAMMRIVAAPLTLGHRQMEPGQAVFLTILSANRDPRVFDQPDALIADRKPNPHLSFGHGVHFCLGSALARLELRIALPRLMERFPRLALAGPIEWKPNISDRAAARVPVRLG